MDDRDDHQNEPCHESVGSLAGLRGQPMGVATLWEAYFGFLTFYVWVVYKERKVWLRILWFLLIMGLGDIAISLYVLIQLNLLRAEEPAETVLWRRAQ
ncbi:MAG: DUF1475 family protein [Bryobacteraceae bacterium]